MGGGTGAPDICLRAGARVGPSLGIRFWLLLSLRFTGKAGRTQHMAHGGCRKDSAEELGKLDSQRMGISST